MMIKFLLLTLLIQVAFARDHDADTDADPNAASGQLSDNQMASTGYRCPTGSLNEGWTVVSSAAFPSDPSFCCGSRTENWEIGYEYDSWYMETGCGLTYPLLGSKVYQFIFPVFCEAGKENGNNDCGDASTEGTAIECCDSGFCAALASNGSSRCEEVTEMWTYDYESNDYESTTEYQPDAIDAYIEECEANKSAICLGCADDCATIGGIELWSAKEETSPPPSDPTGIRFAVRDNRGAAARTVRQRLLRSKRSAMKKFVK